MLLFRQFYCWDTCLRIWLYPGKSTCDKWQVNFEDYDVNVRNLWCLLEVSHKCDDASDSSRVSVIVKLGYVFLTLVLIQHWLFQSQQWKHQGNVWNLFKVNLVSLLLTLNRFHILFWCFHCSLRSSKWRRWGRIKKWEINRLPPWTLETFHSL